MTKIDTHKTDLRIRDGRKVLARVNATGLTPAMIDGIIAAADTELPLEDLVAALEAAVAAALTRKGSVIPDHYRHQYGADQNCGDQIALVLTDAVTIVEGKTTRVDLDAARAIAAANEVEDRFDRWLAKDLNPGMVRMNLGNVLRGKNRRGEDVVIGERRFTAE